MRWDRRPLGERMKMSGGRRRRGCKRHERQRNSASRTDSTRGRRRPAGWGGAPGQVTQRYGKMVREWLKTGNTAVAKGLVGTALPRPGRDFRAHVPSTAVLTSASERSESYGTAIKLRPGLNPGLATSVRSPNA